MRSPRRSVSIAVLVLLTLALATTLATPASAAGESPPPVPSESASPSVGESPSPAPDETPEPTVSDSPEPLPSESGEPTPPVSGADALRVDTVSLEDLSGDDVGSALPAGETTRIRVTLANDGSEPTAGVSAALTSETDGVEVTDPGPKTFGDIAAGGTASADPFEVSVALSASCTDAALTLEATTAQGTATLAFTVPVTCAQGLRLAGFSMSDSETGNGDGFPNPGETVQLFVNLENAGSDTVKGITATIALRDESPFASADIVQGTASFPDAASGETVTNATPFVLRFHEDAPSQYLSGGCAAVTFVPGQTSSSDEISSDQPSSDQTSSSDEVWQATGAATSVETLFWEATAHVTSDHGAADFVFGQSALVGGVELVNTSADAGFAPRSLTAETLPATGAGPGAAPLALLVLVAGIFILLGSGLVVASARRRSTA